MPKHKYSLITCARWEENYISEWLLYHREIGFDHVYLICNDDDPERLYEIVAPFNALPEKEFVTFIHFPHQGQQYFMYLHVLQNHLEASEWIMFLDVDEFVSLRAAKTIDEFRFVTERKFGSFDFLYFNWLMFGAGGFVDRPTGSVLLNYTLRAAEIHPTTKCLARTSNINLQQLIEKRFGSDQYGFWHYWAPEIILNLGDARRINVLGDLMDTYYNGFPTNAYAYVSADGVADQILSRAAIHHYAYKSENDFTIRLNRGISGQFATQTMYEPLTDPAKARAFLLSFDAVTDRTLASFWMRFRQQARLKAANPTPPYPNIAIGKFATQSSLSAWSKGRTLEDDARGALSGKRTGGFGFHTNEEEHPWWRVDLGAVARVFEIRIYNRLDDFGVVPRFSRFKIEISYDAAKWSQIALKNDTLLVGGVDGSPYIFRSEIPIDTRFVKITLLGIGILHLDQIEIFGEI